ncbi:hypothetical protein LJC46_00445 [Desulfovibrio sp. OttesenSCG-928-G15]|nr:hypothetical protein [Desulfovibrio sp. OttesenSCG-928-G15]
MSSSSIRFDGFSSLEVVVRDFVLQRGGFFIAATRDNAFADLLKSFLNKFLCLQKFTPCVCLKDVDRVIPVIEDALAKKRLPLLLIEHDRYREDPALRIQEFKARFPSVPIVVLAMEAERDWVVYLHEQGADNFITKPISMPKLAQKLAVTIKPGGVVAEKLLSGRKLLQNGLPGQVKLIAEDIIGFDLPIGAAYLLLGDAEAALGNTGAAAAAYKKAREVTDMFLAPLQKLAGLAKEKNDQNEYLAYLVELDALSPLNMHRKLQMAETMLTLGQKGQARKLFDEVVSKAGKAIAEDASSLVERIATMYSAHNPEDMETFLRETLEKRKNNFCREDLNIVNQLAMLLRKQGKWQDAIAEYTWASSVIPDDETLQYNMGLAFAQGAMQLKGRRCIEKALELNADFPRRSAQVAYNMGQVLMRGGNREQADRCFSIALELEPGMKTAATALQSLRKPR